MVVIALIAVLGMLAVSTGRNFGSTPTAVADQVVSTMTYSRMRASSTRRIHRVIVQPDRMDVWQAPNTGLAMPTSGWQLVQTERIASPVVVWNAIDGAQVGSGATPAQATALNYDIYFYPDGRSKNAATVFLTNQAQTSMYRVLVYRATGGSYAREHW